VAHAERTGNKLAVLLLDLDHFKEVNDTFGHRIGDLALQSVVKRLAARMRASDTLARTGGDEFTIISDVTDAKGAEILAEALDAALSVPIVVEGISVQTGLSIGIALFIEGGRTPDELLATADRAMYQAKRASRGEEAPGGMSAQSAGYKAFFLSANSAPHRGIF
jgi:diguanylate cyclase (GGDEF)-like protein